MPEVAPVVLGQTVACDDELDSQIPEVGDGGPVALGLGEVQEHVPDSRDGGLEAAHAVAKFFMLQWHANGQTRISDSSRTPRYGDAAITRARAWIDGRWSVPEIPPELAAAAGLTERTFTRRFRSATGYSPSVSLQHKRVHEAKSLLERTRRPVEQVCWAVGYDDPATFRSLFIRLSNVTPGAYRRMPARG